MSIITRTPLIDGALARRQPTAAETIEAMAMVLVEYRAFDEGPAIGKLSGRGFASGQIIKHVDAARERARQLAQPAACRSCGGTDAHTSGCQAEPAGAEA